MNTSIFRKGTILLLFFAVTLAADSDTRTVQAEFDRCHSVMERLERSLRRFEDAMTRIKRTINRLPGGNEENDLQQESATLENRLEYFRNRFERARGQADKISGDLKSVNSPTCPSCISSSVGMYCRNSETLQNSLDEYLVKTEDLLNRLNAESTDNDASGFATQRSATDSLHRSLSTCSVPSAVPLIRQVTVNLQRADSLQAVGKNDDARKALDIARTLAEKAAKRCDNQ